MVWKKIKNTKDITRLVNNELEKIRVARLNIKNIRSAKKNLKRGDGNISVNIMSKI